MKWENEKPTAGFRKQPVFYFNRPNSPADAWRLRDSFPARAREGFASCATSHLLTFVRNPAVKAPLSLSHTLLHTHTPSVSAQTPCRLWSICLGHAALSRPKEQHSASSNPLRRQERRAGGRCPGPLCHRNSRIIRLRKKMFPLDRGRENASA